MAPLARAQYLCPSARRENHCEAQGHSARNFEGGLGREMRMEPEDPESGKPVGSTDHSVGTRLAIISAVFGIGGTVAAILFSISSPILAILFLLICLSVSVLCLDFRTKRVSLGTRTVSIGRIASIFLAVCSIALVIALLIPRQGEIGFTVPNADGAPPPKIIADSGTCVREMRQQYSCDAFLELVSRSESLLISNDRRHQTLDQPIELAVAIGQSKMLSGSHSGANYCRVYDESITEACNTLAGVQRSDLR